AATAPEDATEARRLIAELKAEKPLPRLTFTVLKYWSEATRAALVVEQQLSEIGIDVHIDAVDVEAAGDRMTSLDYGILLMNAGYQPFFYRRVLSGHPANITGYSNPEFDRAVAAGNDARAAQILQDDVPMTPLYST